MRLASYRFDDGVRAAMVGADGASVADLGGAQLIDLLPALPAIPQPRSDWVPLAEERLQAPFVPPLFLGVGLNYRDHAAEQGKALPDRPALFVKAPMAVAAPFGTLSSPYASLDYEGELGVVIGTPCHGVSADGAMRHVAGYVVINDVTVRELVRPDNLVLGKGGSGHGPFGPWLTTADEIADPQALAITTSVNGETRQQSSTANLQVGVAELVGWLSQSLALPAGTVIATGSPGGSGAGFDPPRWLVPGDVVEVAIAGLGQIRHTVVAP